MSWIIDTINKNFLKLNVSPPGKHPWTYKGTFKVCIIALFLLGYTYALSDALLAAWSTDNLLTCDEIVMQKAMK